MAIFSGKVFFLSASLLPPDSIASLQDVLAQNGGEIVHCRNRERNAPNDFHVIFPDWENFVYLREKHCQVVSPQCIFRCAKDRTPLPRVYSCCTAMEGMKVVASGFNPLDKEVIKAFVVSMGGILEKKVTTSTNFVIANTVLTSTYKDARYLEKPIVTKQWLMHCCREHKIVPCEEYRVPCFTGLTICATQITSDKRTRMGEMVQKNGGRFVADLSKNCMHLIAKTPEGQKYNAAINWANTKVVNEEWFWESLSKKVCLDELEYPVSPVKPIPETRVPEMPHTRIPEFRASTSAYPCPMQEPNPRYQPQQDHELLRKESVADEIEKPVEPEKNRHFERSFGRNRQLDDSLYLANCRFYIIGFDRMDMKRMVDMVLGGGGTRYIEFNQSVTHVVMGHPSDSELKDVAKDLVWGAIQVVNSTWLEECSQQKQEVPVTSKHIPSRPWGRTKAPQNLGRSQSLPDTRNALGDVPVEPNAAAAATTTTTTTENGVFSGLTFGFLDSFPVKRRSEVSDRIVKAGGCMRGASSDYLIGNHGSAKPSANVVSTHWIWACTQDKKLLDPDEHVIYRPLSCQIPLPGFEKFRLWISQYPDSERKLFRNLCYLLGAEAKNTNVTHLICQVAYGEKYQSALANGVRVATMDWMRACVTQNAVVAVDDYHPAPPATLSQAGRLVSGELCSPWTKSETENLGKRKSPTGSSGQHKRGKTAVQADVDAWDEFASSWPSGSGKSRPESSSKACDPLGENPEPTSKPDRRPSPSTILEPEPILKPEAEKTCNQEKRPQENPDGRPVSSSSKSEETTEHDSEEIRQPDVAAAIEHLLAHTHKGRREGSPLKGSDEQREVLPETPVNGREGFPLLPSSIPVGSEPKSCEADFQFLESQMDSQVVGYDDDHSDRRNIMEKLRSGNIMINLQKLKPQTGRLGRLFKAAEANK